MNLKTISFIAFVAAVMGVMYLINKNYIITKNPVVIIIQVCSVALMVWARITFGMRSFHATANTTKGRLVTNGPYRWFRHPIYAALIYFFIACIIGYPFWQTIAAVALIVTALFVRMLSEEKFLSATYTEYATYCERTKRIIPLLF